MMSYKLLFLSHRSLIKKMTQTAVINIVFQRIFIKLDVSNASQQAVTKSGTGTWDLGLGDAGTWGLGDVGTRGLGDAGT